MSRYEHAATFALLAVIIGVTPVHAQLPTYGVGRAPTAEEIKAWDLTIRADGRGLPPGSGAAIAGEAVYLRRCAACHGKEGEEPKYNPGYTRLFGGRGTLATDQPVKTVGSFWQRATTLFGYVRRSQPFDEPGVLTDDEVYAVTAYLLYRNEIIGRNDVMDAKSLPLVKMPNRDGFVLDNRPDVGPTARGKSRR